MASQETQEAQESSSTTGEPPLWEYVTKIEKQGNGGTWKFKCKLCSETRKGSYSRVRAYLLGIKGLGVSICTKATSGDKLAMKRLKDAHEEKKAESKQKEVRLPCESGVGFKKRKGISNPIERAFGVESRDQLDQEIARMFYTGGLPFNLARNPHYLRRMFYTGGLPFNLARNPHYLRAFQFAANNKFDSYVPPGYNKLRTTLLQKEKKMFKGTWNHLSLHGKKKV